MGRFVLKDSLNLCSYMKKLILVTNDDGITAPGIRALIEAVKPLGEVYVVAPDKAQSGMGHAITLNNMLRVTKMELGSGLDEYSTSGTPVDCVKLAIKKILPRKPDLIVSGINHGYNNSISVLYSGTMSAAVEGAMDNIPSIGFSLGSFSIEADFEAAKKVAHEVVRKALESVFPEYVCLNVNIPAIPLSELNGIKVCRQARAHWDEKFDERADPYGNPYFWLTGSMVPDEDGEGTDEWALQNQYVSIVPVQYDMTAHKTLQTFSTWNNEIKIR